MSEPLGLFDIPEGAVVKAAPSPAADLGADARRTLRQRQLIHAGIHPLGQVALHPQADPNASKDDRRDRDLPWTCGSCVFLASLQHHDKTYLKCSFNQWRRASNSAATDARRWWPACRDYSPIDPTGMETSP